jgi:hypothetical protein
VCIRKGLPAAGKAHVSQKNQFQYVTSRWPAQTTCTSSHNSFQGQHSILEDLGAPRAYREILRIGGHLRAPVFPRKRFIQRDIKPDSILFALKLTDFRLFRQSTSNGLLSHRRPFTFKPDENTHFSSLRLRQFSLTGIRKRLSGETGFPRGKREWRQDKPGFVFSSSQPKRPDMDCFAN